jgi:cellulose synthase/poly-beta-1,6-N-acetylglucosamine synthase-like glycosyltransferase/peptidoglycan/xylan/chitin deacetylase (PgdA/CDA1 family)
VVDRSVIFYDYSDKRKKYVRRAFIAAGIIVFAGILALTSDLFFSLKKNPSKIGFDPVKAYAYYFTPLNAKKLALTFDDGPNPAYTEIVAKILKDNEVPGTFFFIGENVLKHPNVAENVAEAGFQIGNHTFTHSYDVHSSASRLVNELRTTGKIIEAATGVRPTLYRPPFLLNIGSDPTLNTEFPNEEPLILAYNEGYIPVGADVDSKDWLAKSAGELEKNVLDGAKAGGHIVLLHDGGLDDSKNMVQVLGPIIKELKAEGYTFVPVAELFTPPGAINLGRDLSIGSADGKGDKEVTLLQWFLYTEGFLNKEAINGKFGKDTDIALKNWQLSKGLVKADNLDNPEYGFALGKTRSLVKTISEGRPGAESLMAAVSESGFGHFFANTNLELISGAISLSKYIFLAVITLVIARIFTIVGVFLFSIYQRKRKNAPVYPDYDGGVSILIPAYNEEENIAATIYSILRDKYPLKEIIVINDGSKDKTLEVAREIERRHPELVRVLDIPNGGKANAQNVGISFSRYEVFISMDADTIFGPNTIYNLVKHLGNPGVGAVAGKVATTKAKNILDIFQSIEYIVGQNIEKRVLSTINAVGVIPGPIGAWRKSIVEECGGYSSETLVEDQDLTLAINTCGYKILYEPKAVAYTETPHTLKDFLKQRVRWIYGTFQCAWKYKSYILRNPISSFSLVIVPNILVFSMVVPLFYPVVDILLLLSILLGSWKQVLEMYLIFTVIDIIYSAAAFVGEKENWRRLLFIPIQRLYYRQVIYYVVLKSVLLAVEGTEALWNKVIKRGESQSYYLAHFGETLPAEEPNLTKPLELV